MRQGGCCSQKLTSNSAQRRFFYSLFHTLRYSLALNFPTKRENHRRRRRCRCCTVVANVSSQTLSLGLRRQCHGASKTCNFTLNRLQRRTRAKPSAVALCNVRAYVAYVAVAQQRGSQTGWSHPPTSTSEPLAFARQSKSWRATRQSHSQSQHERRRAVRVKTKANETFRKQKLSKDTNYTR